MRTRLAAHLGSRQVARIIYGAIIGLALVVALEGYPRSAGAMIGWLLGTAVAVALAEFYSEVVGTETSERHRVTRHQLRHLFDDAAAVAFGVAFPAVFFLLVAVGVTRTEAAFALAKWGGFVLIGFYGYWAARFSGASVLRSLAHAGLVGLVAAFLIVLKAALH
jgi:VIT1/CCC1 family predicted Fe2+/Mn2+ transporter